MDYNGVVAALEFSRFQACGAGIGRGEVDRGVVEAIDAVNSIALPEIYDFRVEREAVEYAEVFLRERSDSADERKRRMDSKKEHAEAMAVVRHAEAEEKKQREVEAEERAFEEKEEARRHARQQDDTTPPQGGGGGDQQQKLLQQLMAVTCGDEQRCRFLLQTNDWNLDRAIESFFS